MYSIDSFAIYFNDLRTSSREPSNMNIYIYTVDVLLLTLQRDLDAIDCEME